MTHHDRLWHNLARLDDTRSGVVDGDTIDVIADLGFAVSARERIRLLGVDTAEIYGVSHDSDEYDRGTDHAAFVESWVADAEAAVDSAWPFVVYTEKSTGKYGRWVGDLQRRDTGEWLTDALVDAYPEVADDE